MKAKKIYEILLECDKIKIPQGEDLYMECGIYVGYGLTQTTVYLRSAKEELGSFCVTEYWRRGNCNITYDKFPTELVSETVRKFKEASDVIEKEKQNKIDLDTKNNYSIIKDILNK